MAFTVTTTTMPRSMYNLYKAQGEVLQQLLETLANPPKMVIKKTGPSTFERVTEGKA